MKMIFVRSILFLLLFGALTVSAQKKPKAKPMKPIGDKPSITRIEPRGIQRGVETKIKLIGTNFVGLTELNFSNPKITGEVLEEHDTMALIEVTTSPELARGDYEFSVKNEKDESAKVKMFVDDLPQILEVAKQNSE